MKKIQTPSSEQRFPRRKPNLATPETFARIDTSTNREFQTIMPGLILNVSEGGCGLVIWDDGDKEKQLDSGDKCLIAIGDEEPRLSQIIWKEELDYEVIKMGVSFLDKE